MVHENLTGHTRVLWVQSEAADAGQDAAAGRLERALADAGDTVERVCDVYHALACLLTDGNSQAAVFVNVGDLEPEEFEFFSIVARRREMPPVYVFGVAEGADAMRRALQLGAAGHATADLIRSALLGRKSGGEVPDPDDTPGGDADREPAVAPAWAATVETTNEPGSAPVGPEDAGEDVAPGDSEDTDEDASALRVPWRDYEDQPARQAPSRRPPNDGAEPDPSKERGDDAHQPLLTQEELRALIGDDGVDANRDDARGSEGAP